MDTQKRLVELSSGVVIEEDVLRIAERILEYDPNLRLKFLAYPESLHDAPYGLFELCPDGNERLVFYIWELDERVLQRLQSADTFRHDIQARLDRTNELARRDQKQRFIDTRLEEKDVVEHYLRSRKGRWSFKNKRGDKITLDDQPGRKAVKNGELI